MCTVTFVPSKEGMLLTSNRDEWQTRSSAAPPEKYINNNYVLLYPKDTDKGGTWIVAKNNGDAGVLLNGAYKPHARQSFYRQSRGLVLLEIVTANAPIEQWKQICLDNIEPFTLVLYTNGQLYECCWNGYKKHDTIICKKMAHIWSSVTLYDTAAVQQRKEWFCNWQLSQPAGVKQVRHFHHTAGGEDASNSLVMKRPSNVATVSITTIQLEAKKTTMIYYDIKNDQQTSRQLLRCEPGAVSNEKREKEFLLRIKRMWIRMSHWEYWPFDVLYIPVYLYWVWLSIKSKSFFFFSAANPLIKNAGFLMESKKEIYDQMPQQYYPVTLLCKKGIPIETVQLLLKQKNLTYPLIAKPDIGQRGLQVKLLQSEKDLAEYMAGCRFEFLIQEFIQYKNEIGLFYYRLPGEKKGTISGIVGKEFLVVTGNGHATIEALLTKEHRYLLQLPALQKTHSTILKKILLPGERYELLPYGNHSRGAKFIDMSAFITPDLVAVMDDICQSIPEFYYGRLDIRYADWKDLCKGKDFSIIELNGAGSEPTHIYDPVHSIFFAWKEIMRHLRIVYRISKANSKLKGIKLMSTREGLLMLCENRQYLKILSKR